LEKLVRRIVARIKLNDKQRINRILNFLFLLIPLLLIVSCSQNNGPTLAITVRDFLFEPNSWSVKAGERVTLRMVNESNSEHEWILLKTGEAVTLPFDNDDEARIAFESEVEPGNAKVSFFRAPEAPGVYRIVCGIPGHLENGMQGTLVVK
jgi:uncharacterized cupredoxin-like copper-binding protein